jgi:hypothetical protein
MNAAAFLAQSFHAHGVASAPRPTGVEPMELTPYRLPDGTIVQVDASAAKDARVIGFTLQGGQIVSAERIEP